VFIVDLAVPRDVEREAAELDDVFLYSVDDLAELVRGNLAIRQSAVTEAETIIALQASEFVHWLDSRSVVPAIRAMQSAVDAARAAELERARRALASGASPETVLDALARGLSNKFLHAPMQALNKASRGERADWVSLFQRMYPSPDDEPGPGASGR
jgi:glutamyl-tRNA reductase